MDKTVEKKNIFVTSPSLPSLEEYVNEIRSVFEKNG